MELKHINIANLSISGVNRRDKGRTGLINILLSVRACGVLAPQLVRTNGNPGAAGTDADPVPLSQAA